MDTNSIVGKYTSFSNLKNTYAPLTAYNCQTPTYKKTTTQAKVSWQSACTKNFLNTLCRHFQKVAKTTNKNNTSLTVHTGNANAVITAGSNVKIGDVTMTSSVQVYISKVFLCAKCCNVFSLCAWLLQIYSNLSSILQTHLY